MKLHQSIQVKKTTKLFSNLYQYKVVVRTPCATWFRKGMLDVVLEELKLIEDTGKIRSFLVSRNIRNIKKELGYVRELHKILSTRSPNFLIRVEHPLVSIYTNDDSLVEEIGNLDPESIKYISLPEDNKSSLLVEGVVLVKNIDYGYKVHLGPCGNNESFVKWCEENDKVRLPRRAKYNLLKPKSFGGYYFYVKDEKTLTMVKMFIGSSIHKIEKVVKV